MSGRHGHAGGPDGGTDGAAAGRRPPWLYDQPVGQVRTAGAIGEEIARTAVGSVGMILAIPVTTAVAAASVAAGRRTPA